MSRPIFVCVPGASHLPLIYEPLKSSLSFSGYIAIPVTLPSLGGRPATYDFSEDVHAIRNQVSQLVDAGHDVIVVLHSYAGLPGGEALQGLGRIERQQKGLIGGVVRLVFIMSWMAAEGFQSSPRGDASAFFPYMRINLQAGTSTIDPKVAASVFYNDMPKADAEYWVSQLQPQSIGVFWSKTTFAAWRYIPSTYVVCGKDQAITAGYADIIIRTAQDAKPNMLDTVEHCREAGHCPMLSQVEWTTRMLRRAAGENV